MKLCVNANITDRDIIGIMLLIVALLMLAWFILVSAEPLWDSITYLVQKHLGYFKIQHIKKAVKEANYYVVAKYYYTDNLLWNCDIEWEIIKHGYNAQSFIEAIIKMENMDFLKKSIKYGVFKINDNIYVKKYIEKCKEPDFIKIPFYEFYWYERCKIKNDKTGGFSCYEIRVFKRAAQYAPDLKEKLKPILTTYLKNVRRKWIKKLSKYDYEEAVEIIKMYEIQDECPKWINPYNEEMEDEIDENTENKGEKNE